MSENRSHTDLVSKWLRFLRDFPPEYFLPSQLQRQVMSNVAVVLADADLRRKIVIWKPEYGALVMACKEQFDDSVSHLIVVGLDGWHFRSVRTMFMPQSPDISRHW